MSFLEHLDEMDSRIEERQEEERRKVLFDASSNAAGLGFAGSYVVNGQTYNVIGGGGSYIVNGQSINVIGGGF